MIKQAKSIKAVIFDLSGTLIDFGCKSQVQAMMKLFDKHGLNISESDAKIYSGVSNKDHIKNMFKQEKIRNQYIRKYHQQPNDDFYRQLSMDYETLVEEEVINNSEPVPGAEVAIESLKSKGIKIASTTSYSRPLISKFIAKNFRKSYCPELIITPNEVKFGRPYPYMINQIAESLNVESSDYIVKLGDTELDIEEARNAKVWAGAVIDSSNLMGLSEKELNSLPPKDLNKKRTEVENFFTSKNADFIVQNISSLPEQINEINRKLNEGEYPGGRMEYPQQKYLLYTPGPLTTSKRVKLPLLVDHGSRETEYMETVQEIRKELVKLALNDTHGCGKTISPKNEVLENTYTTVIVQGSGTFGVEATVSSVIPKSGKLLVIINGAYGKRMEQMAKIHKVNHISLTYEEDEVPKREDIDSILLKNPDITHVGVIHSETTTGLLNPIKEIAEVVKSHNKVLIVDAMSSFGAVPIDVNTLGIDYLVSSSNKNIQGVPGFSYVIAKTENLLKVKDATNFPRKTLSLDLYDQWDYLEKSKGGFRFTSPVHTLMSFKEAIKELIEEGGVEARYLRYSGLQKRLVDGMEELNFKVFDLKGYQGPIITTFHSPKCSKYDFNKFYEELKLRKCVIYPGKLTKADSFRIGTIGHLFNKDIENLLLQIKDCMFWDNKI